jgi:hypothetical protein
LPSSSLKGILSLILISLFATGVADTGGKFTAGVVDTCGNFTGGQPLAANISANCRKKFKTALMVYSRAWGKLIHEKNQKQKIS